MTSPSPVTSITGTVARSPRGRVARRSKSGPQPYDFRRPTKLSREHVRTLQIAYETFARHYTTLLTSSLRVVAQVSLVSVEQLTYDEYISALADPTILAMATIEPLPGVMIHELSLPTAMTCVDHLLGGPGGGVQPQRPLSEIEATLLQGLLQRVLGELRYAFDSLGPMQPKLATIEYNPQFAQACAASDTVIVAAFEMKVGAEECVASICLPFNAIAPRLEQAASQGMLTARQRASREAAAVAMAGSLESVPVEVAVRLAPTSMRPVDIVNLEIGDVIPLPHKATAPLAVTAADVTFAYAVSGSQGSRLACLVVDSPEEENPA